MDHIEPQARYVLLQQWDVIPLLADTNRLVYLCLERVKRGKSKIIEKSS